MKRLIACIATLVLMCVPSFAGTIPITGTVRLPNGNLFQGSIRMTLNYPARDFNAGNIVVPQSLTFRVSNGQIQGNSKITPNDSLQPSNTIYVTEYISSQGLKVMQNNFYIQGTSFDIGSATPTAITSSNISFNKFLGLDQITAKNINNIRKCEVFPGATAGAKIIAALADLPSTGGIADCRGFEGAQTISSNITIGANKCVLLGSATFTISATFILQNNSCLRGMGMARESGHTALVRSGLNPIITATGAAGNHVRGFDIKDLYIDGNATAAHGIVLDYVDTFTIDHVELRNGGAANALRLLDEVWDFTIQNSAFVVWGDPSNYTIDIQGLNGGAQITDGHWYGNDIGELTTSAPLLRANAFVLQQRFVDNKFHTSGGTMSHMIDWSGYYSEFLGCSYQGDTAGASGGLIRIKNAENSIVGGQFSDLSNGPAIQILGVGGTYIGGGVKILGSGAPTAASAIVADATSVGAIIIDGAKISNWAKGIDFSTGSSIRSIGNNSYTGNTVDVDASSPGGSWPEVLSGKATATIGGPNLPTARSAANGNNPTLSLGGNTATNVAGYQNLTMFSSFNGSPAQINESIGIGSSNPKLAGICEVDGTGVQHPCTFGYDGDPKVFEVFKKPAAGSVVSGGSLVSISNSGDLMFNLNKGQHIETQAANNDIAGTLTLSAGAQTYTFNVAYSNAPICIAVDTTAANAVKVTTSTTLLTINGTGTDVIAYHCIGNPN